ncbi:MAG: hypothetical protein BJBARM4_0451 [Candidatus Parvarchaeum acidiphilum ARMAN-4]|uniref:Uncharacterized protein n=1 Tax=Candidatus Parvarchaeum acidiphilum ARMAN-4 TaxID=662760 RepID=D2EFD3_PARA4|nr:MAG: hypothetical protein BJBARM4_0451 [Candidatus Parvarchaeum acidiphilum ARMAN-4]
MSQAFKFKLIQGNRQKCNSYKFSSNKENASVSVDKSVLNIVELFRGETPRAKFINDSLKRGLGLFEAVWIFKRELLELSMHNKVIARVTRSSIKPIHKHAGFVEITQESIEFYNKNLIINYEYKPKIHI